MSSTEPRVTRTPEPDSSAERELDLFGAEARESGNGAGGPMPARRVRVRRTPVAPHNFDPPVDMAEAPAGDADLDVDDLLLSELSEAPVIPLTRSDGDDTARAAAPVAPPVVPLGVPESEAAPDDELVADDDPTGVALTGVDVVEQLEPDEEYGEDVADDLVGDDTGELAAAGKRGRLKARKVRRVVRYVSPWSVLKVSLLFYACMWVVGTIASVILWRLAVETGMITNVEKFVAKLFGESQFTIDGREIFRASTIAGVILVFAGTGFTVLLALLFNVICDITGGIRFTVLELETTKKLVKKK